MSAYFIYTTPTEERFRTTGIADLVNVSTNGRSMKQLASVLAMEETKVLVLPDDYREHGATIEHLKAIALHMGLQVMPLTRYLNLCAQGAEPATTALTSAAAPTSQAAGVGA